MTDTSKEVEPPRMGFTNFEAYLMLSGAFLASFLSVALMLAEARLTLVESALVVAAVMIVMFLMVISAHLTAVYGLPLVVQWVDDRYPAEEIESGDSA